MKKSGVLTICLFILFAWSFKPAKAQTTDLLAGNILNGAVNGSLLGLATMGLQNDGDFAPLRIGLGSGILAGAGFAVYDIGTLPQGQEFFIAGTFNDGNNSSIILLLDTLYGAGVGAVLGSAVMLIGNQPQVDGLRYGGSIGAWVGFGFGLFDTFVLAERNQDFIGSSLLNRSSVFEMSNDSMKMGFLSPHVIQLTDFSGPTIENSIEPVLGVFSFRSTF